MTTGHFLPSELTVTAHRDAEGQLLANVPTSADWLDLARLVALILEPIRTLWACPVRVNSAYRGPLVERAVQEAAGLIQPGAPLAPSQHAMGQAADIVPLGDLTIEQAYQLVSASDIPYDQLLLEGVGDGRWVHEIGRAHV
jgi:hypothetical protein